MKTILTLFLGLFLFNNSYAQYEIEFNKAIINSCECLSLNPPLNLEDIFYCDKKEISKISEQALKSFNFSDIEQIDYEIYNEKTMNIRKEYCTHIYNFILYENEYNRIKKINKQKEEIFQTNIDDFSKTDALDSDIKVYVFTTFGVISNINNESSLYQIHIKDYNENIIILTYLLELNENNDLFNKNLLSINQSINVSYTKHKLYNTLTKSFEDINIIRGISLK
jgi:hypothetical protein